MVGWIARIALSIAAVITGWFISTDAANFSIVQMVVATLLFVVLVGAAAFGPSLLRLFGNRRKTGHGTND